jgi:hypothetical protein
MVDSAAPPALRARRRGISYLTVNSAAPPALRARRRCIS